jgi:rubredoxin
MVKEFYADEHNYHLTLNEMIELRLGAKFKCRKCGAEYAFDIPELIAKHGGETRLRYIQRNAKCRYCD